jgi:hypothetical protein
MHDVLAEDVFVTDNDVALMLSNGLNGLWRPLFRQLTAQPSNKPVDRGAALTAGTVFSVLRV